MSAPRVIIAGAGLAGSLLASFLGRRGFRVEVFERRPDPRDRGFAGGRSINLALSTRGLHALAQIDLADEVRRGALPMRGRMMHAVDGAMSYQPYSNDPDDAINSVSRGGLNLTLLDAADRHDTVDLRFAHRVLDVDLDGGAMSVLDETTNEPRTVRGDLIVGADGAFSAIRARMQRTGRFSYSQSYLEHGYKELTIPPRSDGDFALDPGALHIWPRGGFMMIALPNVDRTFTCTLFWPFTGPNGFEGLDDDASVRRRFETQFGDAVPLIPDLVEEYRENPVSSLVTVRCAPWHHGATTVLIGDAAHAVVPFYGQGMNAAFEDCTVLDACIEEHGPDWGRVLESFTALRKENGDAIADMAITNFVEMRDHVGSRLFLVKKRTEKLLHRLFPRSFTPLYNMVTFSTIPYAEARRRAAGQTRVLRATALAALLMVASLLVVLVVGLV